MGKLLYTAEATVTGGRGAGHGRTSDGMLDIELRPPTEGGGTNPEQLFAIGYAACFEEALIVVARRFKVDAGDVSIDSKVDLFANSDRTYGLGVTLDVSLPSLDDEAQAQEIVAEAHRVCPYSNATRGNIDVTLSVNGTAVGTAGAAR